MAATTTTAIVKMKPIMAASTTATIGIIKMPVAVLSIPSVMKTRLHPPRLFLLSASPLLMLLSRTQECNLHHIVSCLPSPSQPPSNTRFSPSTKLFVSGLSFRTTEESLRNAFKTFGELLEVNLVMDKIANRPKGFAFVRYATVEESQKAIEGMHGKFLDGRVIFVEVAKPRSEVRHGQKQRPQ